MSGPARPLSSTRLQLLADWPSTPTTATTSRSSDRLSCRRVVKLISWNTNGRRNTEQQARALLARQPDIVGLQEVTARSVDVWVEALKAGGLLHVRSTVAGSADM